MEYDTDYQDKLNLFKELLRTKYGNPGDPAIPYGGITRINIKGVANNFISLTAVAQQIDNFAVISVRQDASVNQFYIDLDNIELILADQTLQDEFFEKIAGLASKTYYVTEKQIDNVGLLIRFLK